MTTSPALPAPLRETAAEEVRALMARRRISQSRLAQQVGLTQSALSRRLTGDIAFDLDEIERIAIALGVDPRDLIQPGKGGITGRYLTPTVRLSRIRNIMDRLLIVSSNGRPRSGDAGADHVRPVGVAPVAA
jgi:transcriptional regulator with XRE-family HTH domain